MKPCTVIISTSDGFSPDGRVWARIAVMVREQAITIRVVFEPPSL